MRILITNDDGARADGIQLLEKIARTFTDDVWVVAPEFDQSGVSHAISLHEPKRIFKADDRRYFVNGTPADCVVIGAEHLMDRKPDLVLSGINRGMNAADSIAYSGTVGAAMTGLLVGVKAIALSQFFHGPNVAWDTAEAYARPIIEALLQADWPRPIVPNVNFPACTPDEVTGVSVCRPGHGFIGGMRVEERVDVRGNAYHWLQFKRAEEADMAADPECDLAQLVARKITITPLRPDMHTVGDWQGYRDAHAIALNAAVGR